jgi:putative transposase
VVVLETLEVRNMVTSARGTAEQPGQNVRAKAGLNRAILDQGWYAFEQMLAYKLKKRDGLLLYVPAAYTSQRCSVCAHTTPDNRRAQAAFCCVSCGHADNADTNAAKNLRRAEALMGSPKGGHQPHQRRAHEPTRRRA